MNFLRKGSKKSLVKTIHIDHVAEENKTTGCQNVVENGSSNLHRPFQSEINSQNISSLTHKLEKAQREIERLQTENEQMLEARSAAEDRVNSLETLLNEREKEIVALTTKIQTLIVKNTELEVGNSDRLFEAKTKYMTNLEVELEKVKDESTKRTIDLQRKVKKLKEVHRKSKQEYALEIFALKDEKNKLLEENEALRGRLQLTEDCSNSLDSGKRDGEDQEEENEPRSKIIVQLSEQVTRLDVENQKLSKELDKAHVLLDKLTFQSRPTTKPSQQQLCVNMTNLARKTNSQLELSG